SRLQGNENGRDHPRIAGLRGLRHSQGTQVVRIQADCIDVRRRGGANGAVPGPWFFVLGPSYGPWSVVRAAGPGRRAKDEGRTKNQAPRTKDRLLQGISKTCV